MAITKAPKPAPSQDLEKFIQSAPDGNQTTRAAKDEKEEGVQITLRMSKEQLNRITSTAKRQGIPRASYIKRAVFIQLEADEKS